MNRESTAGVVGSMIATDSYTFRVDDAEIARYRAMAEIAERHEGALWDTAGIVSGATVVDLGCGPGVLLPLLARRVAPTGRVIAVDADPAVCAIARQGAAGLDAPVSVVRADAAHTGLQRASVDAIMCRNVLVHNGPRVADVLGHIAQLLRADGKLLSAEPDAVGIDFGVAHAEKEYDQRWAAMMRADGHDPALGQAGRLASLLQRHGWHVVAACAWSGELVIDKSPAWAAADLIVARGFATSAEMTRWRRALANRQADGPLTCTLTTTAVVARPPAEGTLT
jgi:SAM-dependent methyltransferase